MEQVSGPVEDVLRQVIRNIKVQSEYLPDLPFRDPFGPGTGEVDRAVKTLKPTFRFETPTGEIVYAPGGVAGPTKWPLVKGGILVLGFFGIFGIVTLIKK